MSNTKKRNTGTGKGNKDNDIKDLRSTIIFLISAAVTILLFLSNFHIIGKLGDVLSRFMFGLFGYMAYVAPVLIFFAVYYAIANLGNTKNTIKLVTGIIASLMMCVFFTLIADVNTIGTSIPDFYRFSAEGHKGGGIFGGFLGLGMYNLFGLVGSVAIMLLILIICLVIFTGNSFSEIAKRMAQGFNERERVDPEERYRINREREEERKDARFLREKQRKQYNDEEDAYINDVRKAEGKPFIKVRGVGIASMGELDLKNPPAGQQVPEKVDPLDLKAQKRKEEEETYSYDGDDDINSITIKGIDDDAPVSRELHGEIGDGVKKKKPVRRRETPKAEETVSAADERRKRLRNSPSPSEPAETAVSESRTASSVSKPARGGRTRKSSDYKIPPLNLLSKGSGRSSNDAERLKDTARRLKEALKTFGVNVTVKDISRGPAVTRFEVQPEVGVKVNKIVSLTDDLKLNLAAKDIRIEAPIPGKQAVGIEIPNDQAEAVHFRDLLESVEYRNSSAGLTFAVGKDLSGQTIVSDIAKMPHLLIAGSTGSGKSVCINTIIMSILYKSSPDEVKLIMIDPKVVELSVYNGIPHLMLPVVTDPKKAAAALQWAVAEMSRRYDEFGRLNVRNIQGYNEKAEKEGLDKMPLILIIVDEMADLMMVASNEVEAAVCRLAQLARAAGIHLVIATQRPSVDVITGLIKANFPSRIAFAVSSGVDSRTILDKVGAERLLGKGDMLFSPQGLSEPKRVQGAFISDGEISRVVDNIKAQNIEFEESEELTNAVNNASVSSGGGGFTGSSDERDQYFAEAGRYIIEKEKASIGNLQRVYKIGFNRAARIMDQLEEAGVVGPEEGTKPRRVLMSIEDFEALLDQ